MAEGQNKWICPHCGIERSEKPEVMHCTNCGMNFGTPATKDKHAYLQQVIQLNKYDLIIDACAGAGKMVLMKKDRSQSPTEIILGSAPLIEQIKKPSAECVFIECDPKTWKLLSAEVQTEPICKDCNEILLDLVDGSRKTLVFMDPNGYGVYPIRKTMMEELSQLPNTDLLIHFSQLIRRQMGFAIKYRHSANSSHQKRAQRYGEALNLYWGCKEVWENLHHLKCKNKSWAYAETYAKGMCPGNTAEIIQLPPFGKISFFLIFLTKFQKPKRGLDKWRS